MTYRTDEQMLAEQKASGHFVDGECMKCKAKYYINTRYPQTVCTSIIDYKYCSGEIEQKQLSKQSQKSCKINLLNK